jgi:hypothetical protein
VKVGFSWPGFFFSGIWLFVKRLWGYAFAFLALTLLISFFDVFFEQNENTAARLLIIWLAIGLYIFVGARGNQWCATNLERRGFDLIEIVQADTPSAAIAKVAKEA